MKRVIFTISRDNLLFVFWHLITYSISYVKAIFIEFCSFFLFCANLAFQNVLVVSYHLTHTHTSPLLKWCHELFWMSFRNTQHTAKELFYI